jgi:hypothetical protein
MIKDEVVEVCAIRLEPKNASECVHFVLLFAN